MSKTAYVIIGLVALVAIYGLVSYNRLVTMNEGINGQWAQVETQYQRRFDLIPNLVESVKGVMKQEQTVFTALADARTHYSGATTVDEKAAAASGVESALARLIAVVENYPTLKSADTVQTLMAEIEGTENRVSVERKRFNDLVRDYNVAVERFPSSLVARLFGFGERHYFEAAQGAATAPAVKF